MLLKGSHQKKRTKTGNQSIPVDERTLQNDVRSKNENLRFVVPVVVLAAVGSWSRSYVGSSRRTKKNRFCKNCRVLQDNTRSSLQHADLALNQSEELTSAKWDKTQHKTGEETPRHAIKAGRDRGCGC